MVTSSSRISLASGSSATNERLQVSREQPKGGERHVEMEGCGECGRKKEMKEGQDELADGKRGRFRKRLMDTQDKKINDTIRRMERERDGAEKRKERRMDGEKAGDEQEA